jgi:hypothetical protein
MERLEDNWLTSGLIDFEYKKYLLLAYLSSVEKKFTSNKLYPYLGDLVKHYQNLQQFLHNKNQAEEGFQKRLQQIDLENFVLRYEQLAQDDDLMREIEKILNFSIPAIQKQLNEGREIYDWIEEQLHLQPVGIVPLQLQAGYLFIRNGQEHDTRVYRYALSLYEQADDIYRSIQTQYVSTYTTSIVRTYESIKKTLIESQKLLIVPAVYLVETEFKLPLDETLLPIARRKLVQYLAAGGR